MELTIKELCGYLPYGLRIKTDSRGIFKISGYSLLKNGNISLRSNDTHLDYLRQIKPILRPLSDLQNLIKDEFEKYDGLRSGKADEEIINLFCEENGVDEILENIELKSLPYECIEFMFKNHFDFYGLIENNLAIDFNTL